MKSRSSSALLPTSQQSPSVIALPKKNPKQTVSSVNMEELVQIAKRIEILSSQTSYDEALPTGRLDKIHDLILIVINKAQNS